MYVCLFDIDGTLLSSGGAGKHAMYAAIRSEFAVAEVIDGVPFAGRTDRAIVRDVFALHSIDDSPQNWQRFLTAYLRHLPRSLTQRPGKVLPGVSELLDQLRARGDVAIGLLTGNVRDGARAKLSHYGLYEYFAFGGYGDDHLDRNDVAREALERVNAHAKGPVHPASIWVIGDTPLDVRCARAVGARCLAVASGFHSWEQLAAEAPDLLLPDLSQASLLCDSLS
jgi:phosphoglycolate phosphatase-like HAD superfamily hydrolase